MQAKIMQGDGNIIEVDNIKNITIFNDDGQRFFSFHRELEGEQITGRSEGDRGYLEYTGDGQ